MDLANFTGDTNLRHALEARPHILLVARNSGMGSRARTYAADELGKAVRGLQTHLGLDFSNSVPPNEVIHQRLKSSPSVRSETAAGDTFHHKILLIDDHVDKGLIILIGTGTGRKTDTDGDQPFVRYLMRTIKEYQPALIFANRFDRFLRSPSAAVQLYEMTNNHGIRMGDSQEGIHPHGGDSQLVSYIKAYSADREAQAIPVKTRQSMRIHSGQEMVNGFCNFAAQTSPPPGLARIRLKSATGSIGRAALIIDSPSQYPDVHTVAGGLPQVRVDGKLVDQAALVCWALENLGKPGYTRNFVGAELARRGFSTDKYRSLHGASCSYPTPPEPGRAALPLRAILANLDFYRTGILHVSPGGGKEHDFEIKNCFPARGFWATKQDFDRIQAFVEGTPRKRGRTLLSLTGVDVTADGVPGKLALCELESATYRVRFPGKDGPRSVPRLPHQILAEVIAEGLQAAAQRVFIPVVPEESPEMRSLQSEIDAKRATIGTLAARYERLKFQVLETDDEGVPVLPPTMRRELGEESERVMQELSERQGELQKLHRQRKQMVSSELGSTGAPVNRLLVLVDSLRDPRRTEYNSDWKQALTLRFTSEKTNHHGLRSNVTAITGELRVSHEDNHFIVPLCGSYQSPTRANPHASAEKAKEQMLQGTPFHLVNVGMKTELRQYVALAFGKSPDMFPLATCPDSRITRVGAHLLLNPEWSVAQASSELGEPIPLIEQVQCKLTSPTRKSSWLRTNSSVIALFTDIAHRHDGYVRRDQLASRLSWSGQAWYRLTHREEGGSWVQVENGLYLLDACRHCGSRIRSSNRLWGVSGWVCSYCRLDDAGVQWSRNIDAWNHVVL